MTTPSATDLYKRHRFLAQIISHCVWLSCRFCLSYRDVEELMADWAVGIPGQETGGTRVRSFSSSVANATPSDAPSIRSAISLISLCNAVAKIRPKKFSRKLLKGLRRVPGVIVTNKLRSYGAAKWEVMRSVTHRQHPYVKNRAENSHQPTRQREQRMQRFNPRGTPSDSW